MDTMTVDEILDRAADMLDLYGWNIGDYRAETGEVCTLGAMNIAAYTAGLGIRLPYDNGYELIDAVNSAETYLALKLKMSIPLWNDNCCRGRDEAAALLRSTAKSWREENSR